MGAVLKYLKKGIECNETAFGKICSDVEMGNQSRRYKRC
jgi:hypothetical protein